MPGPGRAGGSARDRHARSTLGAGAETGSSRGYTIGFGIGIAQGYATLGRIGFEGRFDYAAIGTVTNVAARLCAEAQDSQILVTQRIAAEVADFANVSPLGEIRLKGLSRPVAVFNVEGLKAPPP